MFSGSYYKSFRVDGTGQAIAIDIASSNWCDQTFQVEQCGYFFYAGAKENISVFAVRKSFLMMIYAEDKERRSLFVFRLFL